MPKHNAYNVNNANESNQHRHRNKWFKISACLIFQFIALCIIIVIAANWEKMFRHKKPEDVETATDSIETNKLVHNNEKDRGLVDYTTARATPTDRAKNSLNNNNNEYFASSTNLPLMENEPTSTRTTDSGYLDGGNESFSTNSRSSESVSDLSTSTNLSDTRTTVFASSRLDENRLKLEDPVTTTTTLPLEANEVVTENSDVPGELRLIDEKTTKQREISTSYNNEYSTNAITTTNQDDSMQTTDILHGRRDDADNYSSRIDVTSSSTSRLYQEATATASTIWGNQYSTTQLAETTTQQQDDDISSTKWYTTTVEEAISSLESRNQYFKDDATHSTKNSLETTTEFSTLSTIIESVETTTEFPLVGSSIQSTTTLSDEEEKIVTTNANEDVVTTTISGDECGNDGSGGGVFRKSAPVCDTYECKSVASRMLSLMNDLAYDACEDFYAFACGNNDYVCGGSSGGGGGGGGSSSALTTNNADSDPWSIHLKQIIGIKSNASSLIKYQSFYNSCTNFFYNFDYKKRIAHVTPLLHKFISDMERIDVTDFIILMLKMRSNLIQFDSGIDEITVQPILEIKLPDKSSTKINTWSAMLVNQRRCLGDQLYSSSSSSSSSNNCETNLNLTKMHESYVECQHDDACTDSTENLLKNALDAFAIPQVFSRNFTKFLKIYPTQKAIKLDLTNRKFQLRTIGELTDNITPINWLKVIKATTRTNVHYDTPVRLYFADYFHAFSNFTDLKQILLNELIVEMYLNYVMPTINEDVETHCLRTTVNTFNDIASYLYVDHFNDDFVAKQKQRVKELFDGFKKVMKKNLENANLTFGKLVAKLDYLVLIFSDKAHMDGIEELNARYAKVHIAEDNFISNVFDVSKHQLTALLKEKKYWFGSVIDAFETEPVTFYESLNIYVPLGYVANVDFNLPEYIALAKIGFHLAKAIGKHFDAIGINHGIRSFGTSKESTYEELISNMNNLLNHIKEKYSFEFFYMPELSTNDRIADNTAMRLLTDYYISYEDDNRKLPWIEKSKEEIFYIAIAQEFCRKTSLLQTMLSIHESNHLPNWMRVENIFQNSEHFIAAFKCGTGMGMKKLEHSYQFPFIDEVYDDDPLEF